MKRRILRDLSFYVVLGCLLTGLDGNLARSDDKIIGPVVAVERTVQLNFEDCVRTVEEDYYYGEYCSPQNEIGFRCVVNLFPKNDEEILFYSDVADVDAKERLPERQSIFFKTIKHVDNKKELDIGLFLVLTRNGLEGYEISSTTVCASESNYPELNTITTEDFLKTAKMLIEQVPTMTVKFLKVQRQSQ